MEEENKYWLEEQVRNCILCKKSKDTISHYMKKCEKAKDWFIELGNDREERWEKLWDDELDDGKEKICKLQREREKELKKKRKREGVGKQGNRGGQAEKGQIGKRRSKSGVKRNR